ncbi:MAG: hypothetical protein NWE89_04605 [Candidatus Bathyarchaeota archaeon]|nr:hypothetical protein [Candidatus Bathyarchaeota archaeon]
MSESITIQKSRRIPTQGEVFVKVGDEVQPDTLVARGVVPNPEAHDLRVYSKLGVDPEIVENFMLKGKDDDVKRDEVIAIARSFFGRRTKVARSPIDGKIEGFYPRTGRVIIRGHPIKVEVDAHIPGKVIELYDGEGAMVETSGFRTEGVFGVGGEARGELAFGVDSRDLPLTSEEVKPEHKGKVIIGGSVVTLDALRAAVKHGVSGVIVGGVDQKDITYFLGYEIGVGVTGSEDVGLTLILTEGFGVNPMSDDRFEALRGLEGKLACIDGSTQIRSRSLRPEVVVPL